MKDHAHLLDDYFCGQTTPEAGQQLAQALADDTRFADEFVEQARLDALLSDVYTDQRASQFHAALVAQLTPVAAPKLSAGPSGKIVRRRFAHWQPVAAALVTGGFLWGIASVWHGAAQLSEVSQRRLIKPKLETSVAAVAGITKPLVAEDRELEAWLRAYYVNAQPWAERSLQDWLAQLVEQEFPRHNHLNKHRELTWEIRTEDAHSQAAFAQQSVKLGCSAASLLDQVKGLAALAGCELRVEPGKLVLAPMKEASTGLETKEFNLAAAFLRGETAVHGAAPTAWQKGTRLALNSAHSGDSVKTIVRSATEPNRDQPELTTLAIETDSEQPLRLDTYLDARLEIATRQLAGSSADAEKIELISATPANSAIPVTQSLTYTNQPTTDPTELAKSQIQRAGIVWSEGSVVAEVTPLPVALLHRFSASRDGAPSNLNFYGFSYFQTLDDNLTDSITTSPEQFIYKATVTTSPLGIRQLEILSQLTAATVLEPKLIITEFVVPASKAPRESDRVLQAEEVNAVKATYRELAEGTLLVNISPENTPASPALVSNDFRGGRVPNSEQVIILESSDQSSELATPLQWSEGLNATLMGRNLQTGDLAVQTSPVNLNNFSPTEAKLTLTRSGELLRISGAINQVASTPNDPHLANWNLWSDQANGVAPLGNSMAEYREVQETTAGAASASRATMSLDYPTARFSPPFGSDRFQPSRSGVDLSLSLFPSQGALVLGPNESGQERVYVLELAK